jgi:hypothetical protein
MRSPAYSVGATHGHELLQIVAVAMLGFPVLRSERIGTQAGPAAVAAAQKTIRAEHMLLWIGSMLALCRPFSNSRFARASPRSIHQARGTWAKLLAGRTAPVAYDGHTSFCLAPVVGRAWSEEAKAKPVAGRHRADV